MPGHAGDTASRCRKHKDSAFPTGLDNEFLLWKSNNAHADTHRHTHTGTLHICQKSFPWTNDDLWEAALFLAFLLFYFRRIYPDHVFLLSLTHSEQAFCIPCAGERSSLKKQK